MLKMNPFIAVLLFASFFLIQGCIATIDAKEIMRSSWNVPSSDVSAFDKSKIIKMSNVPCGEVVLNLYQDTAKAKQNIVLVMAGTRSITNIGDDEALLFNVDGKIHSFKSSSPITEHDSILVGTPDIGYSEICICESE